MYSEEEDDDDPQYVTMYCCNCEEEYCVSEYEEVCPECGTVTLQEK